MTTPSEHLASENVQPPADWPSAGRLQLSRVTAAYTKGSVPVLQDVSLSIPAGAKIGICGRSDSGESSLLLTLFRVLDPSSGEVQVDGLDLATLPRAVIRSRFTALPQDALSVQGSVRTNLDPLKAHYEAISSALLKVGLLGLVNARGGLDTAMNSLGLSQGEMQLFAVARALLRPNKLLIIDEMTSAVDGATEERILELVRKEFGRSTVIAVAHRLRTIVDFDLLVFMHEGRLVEYGAPRELLEKDVGWFKSMWESDL